MSVLPSKKPVPLPDIKQQVMDLYVSGAKIAYDESVVPKPLNAEFRYPITNNLRDLCCNVSMALTYKPLAKNNRRLEAFLKAYDDTVIHQTYLDLLSRCRPIDHKDLKSQYEQVFSIQRSIKAYAAADRMAIDQHLHSKREAERLQRADDVIDIDPSSISEQRADLFDKGTFKKKTPLIEMKKQALESVPKIEGIVNDPTGLDSPVLFKVRAIQKTKAQMTAEEIRKLIRRKSSK